MITGMLKKTAAIKREKYAQHNVIKPPELRSNKFLKSQRNAKKPKCAILQGKLIKIGLKGLITGHKLKGQEHLGFGKSKNCVINLMLFCVHMITIHILA